MNLQEKIHSETTHVKVTIVDTRGWHLVKKVVLAFNLFLSPIIFGTVLGSVILQIIGLFLGCWIAVAFLKNKSGDGGFKEFGSIPAAIEHLKKVQREELA